MAYVVALLKMYIDYCEEVCITVYTNKDGFKHSLDCRDNYYHKLLIPIIVIITCT